VGGLLFSFDAEASNSGAYEASMSFRQGFLDEIKGR
jgi:hypothetical protein